MPSLSRIHAQLLLSYIGVKTQAGKEGDHETGLGAFEWTSLRILSPRIPLLGESSLFLPGDEAGALQDDDCSLQNLQLAFKAPGKSPGSHCSTAQAGECNLWSGGSCLHAEGITGSNQDEASRNGSWWEGSKWTKSEIFFDLEDLLYILKRTPRAYLHNLLG